MGLTLQQQLQQAYQQKDFSTAETLLRKGLGDGNEPYRIELANLLCHLHRANEAVALFANNDANSLFNRAYYASKACLTNEALSTYLAAIEAGLSDAFEAHTNMGVILREEYNRDQEAECAFKQALQLNPNHAPALINLANLYEDQGRKAEAEALLAKISASDHYYPMALCRLAALRPSEQINQALHEQLHRRALDADTRCDILYAIGHQWDKTKHYSKAKKAFDAANKLNAQLIATYDKSAWEQKLQNTLQHPPAPMPTLNLASPKVFFICGMFRSGSTLLEQMLAAHPRIAAGGELRLFPKLATGLNQTALEEAYDIYRQNLQMAANTKPWVSDKRNDNLWQIDMIKQVFPAAKIIITERDVDDCAISIYQQRLGPTMNYACDMSHIRHYEGLCQQLKQHWFTKYPDDVISISYEALIRSPQVTLEKALHHLGEIWDDTCLDFHRLHNTVKTASVWQVRAPLSDQSIGRGKRYL